MLITDATIEIGYQTKRLFYGVCIYVLVCIDVDRIPSKSIGICVS